MKLIFLIIFVSMVLFCSCGEINMGRHDEVQASVDHAFSIDEQKPITVKTVRYDCDGCVISLTIPESWNYYVVEDDGIMELQHVGIQLYDGEVPEQKEMYGGKLFVAVAASGRAVTHVDTWTNMGKPFTEEVYTSESGLGMKLYYLDGKLDYATFDDYSELCIFFNLDDGDGMDEILGIVDSIVFERAE